MNSFSVGDFETTGEMRALVNQVLDSGRISYGKLSRQFERDFASIHGCDFGVLSNSGTSSLQVALQALKELHGWADGDEVIIPALTFVATANIVYHCRMVPILVDVEPNYYALDPKLIEAAFTPKTRCIIPVHPFGQPADMIAIKEIVDYYNLALIEDSCEAMFVSQDSCWVGSFGDVGCFSTYVAHLITGGVGGIGITNDYLLARRMRSLVNHGISLVNLPSGQDYDPSFLARNFAFESIGHSFRVTELEAALLLPQLARAHEIIRARRDNAHKLNTIFGQYEDAVQLPAVRPGCGHAFMVYPLVMRQERKQFIMRYLRDHDIGCRDMLPLTNQPCYHFEPERYPIAEHINQSGFYIGCHPLLADVQFDYLSSVVDHYFRG